MKIIYWIIALLVAIVIIWAVILTLMPNQNQTAIGNVMLSTKAGIGQYLTDDKGLTLYYFANDELGKSNCTGQCLVIWPVFYGQNITVTPPLTQSDFDTITRDDGTKQTTYKGWPLYYYQSDVQPGDTSGEGVGQVWYIIPEPFYTVMVENKPKTGTYLIDPKEMTLYYTTNDVQGTSTSTPQSNCVGQCSANWPVFNMASLIAPSLMNPDDFISFTRQDGSNQIAYKGWPLYYYVNDKNPGEINGQGVNSVWFLAEP